MCHSSPGWKQHINCLARGHTVQLGPGQEPWEPLQNTCSTLPLICDITYFLGKLHSSALDRKKVFVSSDGKKKASWFSLIMRSVKQCSVHFWPNFIFPYLLSVLHHTEHTHLETTQTMNVRIRQHFLQHLLLEERAFWRNGVKWSSSALLGTKSLPAAKSSAKTLGRNSWYGWKFKEKQTFQELFSILKLQEMPRL